MKKLISNPFECGYCNIEENYRDDKCKHPKKKTQIICKGDKFPDNCPLETNNIIKKIIIILNKFNLNMLLLFGGTLLPPERRSERDKAIVNELNELKNL